MDDIDQHTNARAGDFAKGDEGGGTAENSVSVGASGEGASAESDDNGDDDQKGNAADSENATAIEQTAVQPNKKGDGDSIEMAQGLGEYILPFTLHTYSLNINRSSITRTYDLYTQKRNMGMRS